MVAYFFLFVLIWLIVLSFFLIKTRNHYHRLVSGMKKNKLDEILDQIISNDHLFEQEIKKITSELKKIDTNANYYFQKIGFIRYNPFDGRGEQSFVLALLNKKNCGLILNFIYTRDGLRVYTKAVKDGKGDKYQLSEEEKKAVETSHN